MKLSKLFIISTFTPFILAEWLKPEMYSESTGEHVKFIVSYSKDTLPGAGSLNIRSRLYSNGENHLTFSENPFDRAGLDEVSVQVGEDSFIGEWYYDGGDVTGDAISLTIGADSNSGNTSGGDLSFISAYFTLDSNGTVYDFSGTGIET